MIKINEEIVDIKHYPDGTQRFEFSEKIKEIINRNRRDSSVGLSIDWKYESDEELFSLCCLKDWIDENIKDSKTYLFMYYLPNARMDRVKDVFDVFTLKTFCKIINSLNFTRVYVMDVHSNVSVALLNNCLNGIPKYYVNKVFEKEQIDLIFYPDEGSSKRYAYLFEIPYMFGIKKRDWKTGKINGLDVVTNDNEYNGKNVLIMDDICSYGGTIYHSAKKLKELGVNEIYVFVTHCEDSILDGELIKSGLVEKIYTTGSLISTASAEHPLIEIIG